MSTSSGPKRPRFALALAVIGSLAVLTAACGGGSTGGSTAGSSTTNASKCGLGNGQKATGAPLTLGAIVTKQPGTDFTGITGMAQAYFSCVNDNGGINGRPVKYIVENEQTDPQQVAALATKLIDDDKVLAIVGSTSLIDCPVNHTLYEQRGFNVIVAGVPFACFSTPNIAAVNMGPYYSSEGAAQYLVRQGVKTMVVAGANVPGGDHDISGVTAIAKANNIPSKGAFLENVPISDASGIAVQLTQAAGDGGGVVLNFTPPEGLKILQAAEQQGLVDKVKWAWSTPGNDASVVQALGPAWNGKLGVNAELNLVDSTGPDNELYQKITKQYAPTIPLGSFGQMGFVAADIITHTLLGLPADQLTPQGVNAAIRQIKNFKTDILCKPWYYGDLQVHVPNNADRTVVPQNHVFIQKEGCFDIAPLPGNNLDTIRQQEKSQGLNGS
ncbi:MAG TPA: ABC transporter substrate-binding protein [Terriglobales bacterium]|nr:ABC transporter substrate-binding protein [Terriglobales bacterium]